MDAPVGASIDPASGLFAWTPEETQGSATNLITVVVTDSGTPALAATNQFSIIVNEVNRAPVLPAQTDLAINELAPLAVVNTATDADLPANALTYTLTAGPANAAIAANGVITWTPTEAQGPGVYTFTTVVTDNNPAAVNSLHLSATNSFAVTVHEINTAPVLPAQTDLAINELAPLTVVNIATDADLPANTLTYTLTAGPANAAIAANGVITWTPTEAQGPGVYTFTTVVTDHNPSAVNSQHLSATNSFAVTVREINTAPALADADGPGDQRIDPAYGGQYRNGRRPAGQRADLYTLGGACGHGDQRGRRDYLDAHGKSGGGGLSDHHASHRQRGIRIERYQYIPGHGERSKYRSRAGFVGGSSRERVGDLGAHQLGC